MDAFEAEVWDARDRILLGLPPTERSLLLDTRFVIQGLPDSTQLGSIQPGAILLGLYTTPPPVITVFRGNIERVGKPAREVVAHEIGHRLGLNHVLAGMAHRRACGVDGAQPLRAAAYVI